MAEWRLTMRKIVSSILALGLVLTQSTVIAEKYSMEISGIIDPISELILINGSITSGPDEVISVVTSDASGNIVFADEISSLSEGKFKSIIDVDGMPEGDYLTVFRAADSEDCEFGFSIPIQKNSAVKISAEISGNDLLLIKDSKPDELYSKITVKVNNAKLLKGMISADDYIVTGLPDGYYITACAVEDDIIEFTMNGSGIVEDVCELGIILKSSVISGGKANTSSDKIEGIFVYPEEYGKIVNLDLYDFEAHMTDEKNVNVSKSTFEIGVMIRDLLKDGVLEKGVDYDYTLPTSLSGLKCELSANKENGSLRLKFSGNLTKALTADAVISDFVIKAGCVNGAEKDSEPITITFKKANVPSKKPSGGSGGGSGNGTGYTGGNNQIVEIEPTVPKIEIVFADVKGHWAEKEIHTLAGDGVINGVGDNKFAPERKITRAEFVALIVRAFGLTEGRYNENFEDVAKNDWYSDGVGKAMTAGIISKDTYFRPNDPISREEMVKIIVGGWLSKNEKPEWINMSQFSDKTLISDWATEFVDIAVTLGLVKGDNNGNFNPKSGTTRAEAATVIYRLIYLN